MPYRLILLLSSPAFLLNQRPEYLFNPTTHPCNHVQ